MVEKSQEASIRKQVEYYLSDKNLTVDTFFHDKISRSQDVSPLFNFLRDG